MKCIQDSAQPSILPFLLVINTTVYLYHNNSIHVCIQNSPFLCTGNTYGSSADDALITIEINVIEHSDIAEPLIMANITFNNLDVIGKIINYKISCRQTV